MELILALSLFSPVAQEPASQAAPERISTAVIVPNAIHHGRLQPGRMGMGSGGFSGRRAIEASTRGVFHTPGGAVLQAKRQGLKVTLPNGKALLVAPNARVHLRSGEATLPWSSGVRLMLADGTVVTARRGVQRGPFRSVVVEVAGRMREIWTTRRAVAKRGHRSPFWGPTLLVLGDGQVLYRVAGVGPVLALERVLCSRPEQARWPRERVVILGDLLAESMRLLPKRAPRKSVQYPDLGRAMQILAKNAGQLFEARPIHRAPGAVGELWLALPQGYRLRLQADQKGRPRLQLFRGAVDDPAVEWVLGVPRTEIYMVRPSGGRRGPRYFMRGIDLRLLLQKVLPGKTSYADQERARAMFRRLAGRRARPIPVRRH